MGHRAFKAEFDFFLQIFIRLLEHAQIVLCAEMTHTCRKQVQVVLQSQFADVGTLRREDLGRGTVLHVDFVDIIDELHDFIVRQILIEPAAELGREIVLAIRESTGTAKAAHDAAGLAADAALDLARGNRADAVVDVLAALKNNDMKPRLLLHEFIGRHDTGRTAADNGHIVFFHQKAS